MKKLLLVALCSTSLLSVARGEGSGGMGGGDAMHPQDAAKEDATQAPRTEATQPKKPAKKQAADPKTKHGGMDDGAMEHGAGMDHGSMQHDAQMDSGMK